jgi:hypothetical protein
VIYEDREHETIRVGVRAAKKVWRRCESRRVPPVTAAEAAALRALLRVFLGDAAAAGEPDPAAAGEPDPAA